MSTDRDERLRRLDGPIHGWFGLTYSNYLVLHRSMMQSMPVDWQECAVSLFDELDNAFPDLERPPSFIVTAATECEYSDLTLDDMAQLGIRPSDGTDDFDEDEPAPGDAWRVYYDRDGDEHQASDRLLVPVPGGDPVPPYNRGRTFIEPTGLADEAVDSKPEPRTWSLPPEPGPEVTKVRDEAGNVYGRANDGCWSNFWRHFRWEGLLNYGPLTDATHEPDQPTTEEQNVSDIVDPDEIEAIVGLARHDTEHYGRAVSAEQRVYILHPRQCRDAVPDLRDCPYSDALDWGIDAAGVWPLWAARQDVPVRLVVTPDGLLAPDLTTEEAKP